MTEEDSREEQRLEAASLASRRLHLTMACYDKLMDFWAQVAAATVYKGQEDQHLADPPSPALAAITAVQHADAILRELGLHAADVAAPLPVSRET